jgi:hypothetical protein
VKISAIVLIVAAAGLYVGFPLWKTTTKLNAEIHLLLVSEWGIGTLIACGEDVVTSKRLLFFEIRTTSPRFVRR